MNKNIQFIQITPEQLKESIIDGVKNVLDDLKQNFQPKEPTEFLTRSEVSKLLKIDLSTVHNWTKKGKLNPYGIGNRIYYKRSEIEKSLVKLNK